MPILRASWLFLTLATSCALTVGCRGATDPEPQRQAPEEPKRAASKAPAHDPTDAGALINPDAPGSQTYELGLALSRQLATRGTLAFSPTALAKRLAGNEGSVSDAPEARPAALLPLHTREELRLFLQSADSPAALASAPHERFEQTSTMHAAIKRWLVDFDPKLAPLSRTPLPDGPRVLATAFALDTSWRLPFSPTATKRRPFVDHEGRRHSLETMHDTRFVSTATVRAAGHEVRVLRLELGVDAMSLVLVLPDPKDTLASVEATLSPSLLQQWFQATRGPSAVRHVALSLPKMSLHSVVTFDATTPKLRTSNVDQVLHAVSFELNEHGAEDALESSLRSAVGGTPPAPPPEPLAFERPFLFMIFDHPSEELVLLGRFKGPARP